MKLVHSTYNEMLALSGGARSVLGVWPEDGALAFKLFPGKFEKALLKEARVLLYASCSSREYADFAVFKERKLRESPLGPGPEKWYLAVDCRLVAYVHGFPSLVYCEPVKALWRPAPPLKRSLFYIIEALVLVTRLHLKDESERILKLLEEARRLGDEEDLEVVKKLEVIVRDRGEVRGP